MATATTSAMPTVPAGTSSAPASDPMASPQRRPRKTRKNDSFMIFEHASIPHTASAEDLSRQSTREDPSARDEADPLYRRLIMVPLLSVSFILSLFIVERSERARRSSEHPSQNQSFWNTFSLQNWLDPEPYQDPNDTTWGNADGSNPQEGQVPRAQRKQWYVRKKKAKVGRMNITDAFDLSGTVMVMLLVFACIAALGLGWGGMKAYHGLMARIRP